MRPTYRFFRGVPGLLILTWITACGGDDSTGPEGNQSREVPVFQTHLVDLSSVSLIVPTGSISGNEVKGHAFVRFQGASIAIHAPFDMELTAGTWVGVSNDYGFEFDINARFRFRLGHIDEPRPDLAALIPRTDPSSIFTRVGPISIRAGELIGHATAVGGSEGFDVGLYDLDVDNQTPNAERYRRIKDWEKLNSVCPFAYFDGGLRGGYSALFGSIGGVPVPNAPCRTIGDVVGGGGLAGEWYLESHAPDGVYGERFAVGRDLAGLAVRIAGIGGNIDVIGAADPQTIADQACYADGGRFIFIRRTSSTTADAVLGTGACPATFPEGQHRSYER
ncbi:MAG: hypothetical protein KJO11_01025 [Gemmatimonadetes bacterium]|nr:hypothetical protein [Gemmatimonadota bacterium]NNF39404.1 hypothetical protein [Gemmatimonadota bacterium]NNK64344.1 hypothetical protein [Gemmatimonadota bacterium]